MERCIKIIACFFLLTLFSSTVFSQPFGLQVLSAQTTVKIPIAWDHDDAASVAYYSIYLSTVQGQFEKPYLKITRLANDGSPFILTVPADGVARFVVIRAVNSDGESADSNQITFTPSCEWSDLN